MQLRTTVLALVLAASVIGCQATPQAREESTRVPSPSEVPAPAPAEMPAIVPPPAAISVASQPEEGHPPDDELERDLCAPTASPRPHDTDSRLQDALRLRLQVATIASAPQIVASTASCLASFPVKGSDGKLLWVALRPAKLAEKDLFAVWLFNGTWQVAHLPVDKYRTLPNPMYYKETPDGAEVVSLGRNPGSGHAGSYSLIRFSTGMKVLWQTELYGYLDDHSINDQLLRATYRDRTVNDETHVYWASCCLPTNGQTIWVRQGDIFVEKAVRKYPSVLRAASAFVGAWNANKLDLAGAYAGNGRVVADMIGDATQPPQIKLGQVSANVRAIEQTEEAYWEALPPEYRGPKPTVVEFVWPATPQSLLLKRIDGQWKVTGWHVKSTDPPA